VIWIQSKEKKRLKEKEDREDVESEKTYSIERIFGNYKES